jgi:hypothetical protein
MSQRNTKIPISHSQLIWPHCLLGSSAPNSPMMSLTSSGPKVGHVLPQQHIPPQRLPTQTSTPNGSHAFQPYNPHNFSHPSATPPTLIPQSSHQHHRSASVSLLNTSAEEMIHPSKSSRTPPPNQIYSIAPTPQFQNSSSALSTGFSPPSARSFSYSEKSFNATFTSPTTSHFESNFPTPNSSRPQLGSPISPSSVGSYHGGHNQARMARGIHVLPKISPGPARPDPSTLRGQVNPETALRPFLGWLARMAGGLRPSSTPLDTPCYMGLVPTRARPIRLTTHWDTEAKGGSGIRADRRQMAS